MTTFATYSPPKLMIFNKYKSLIGSRIKHIKIIKNDKNLRQIPHLRTRHNIPLKKGLETDLVKYSDIVLEPGCYYFIDDILERTSEIVRTVLYGKYVSMIPYTWEDRFDDSMQNNIEYTFSDIQYIVKPDFRKGNPVGNIFSDEGHIFIKDILAPCESDRLNKQKNIKDLEETLDELKVKPVEKGEIGIDFIGKEYRENLKRWNEEHSRRSASKSASKSHSKSTSKYASKKGGKNKTQKQKTKK